MGWELRSVVACLAISAAACAPQLPDADLPEIAAGARQMMDRGLTKDAVIDSLKEGGYEALRVESSGVYVRIGGFFATEYGYFVPRDPDSFDSSKNGDPRYRLLGHGVYRYDVAG